MDDFEACIAHLRMPVNHRRAIRMTDEIDQYFLPVLGRLVAQGRPRSKERAGNCEACRAA